MNSLCFLFPFPLSRSYFLFFQPSLRFYPHFNFFLYFFFFVVSLYDSGATVQANNCQAHKHTKHTHTHACARACTHSTIFYRIFAAIKVLNRTSDLKGGNRQEYDAIRFPYMPMHALLLQLVRLISFGTYFHFNFTIHLDLLRLVFLLRFFISVSLVTSIPIW